MNALAKGGVYLFEGFRLDRNARVLFRRDEGGTLVPIAIGSRALEVLGVLVGRAGDLVPRDELMAAVWPATAVEETNLNMQIAALRRILDEGRADGSCIQTVPGRGYRFAAPVTRVPADASGLPPGGPPPLPDKPSLAVMPFQNMSGDPEQEYFADGMVEEIITALSRIRWLFVIARNSSFTYKGQAVDVKRVGSELGVRYVLEGAVRKAGGRVRISAQLIDATTGAHLWADRSMVFWKTSSSFRTRWRSALPASSSRPWKRPRPAARPTGRQTTLPPSTSIYARSELGHSRGRASFGRSTCSGKRLNAIRITARLSPWPPIVTKGSR
jgi:TolB-like protein